MVSKTVICKCCKATSKTENKEQKLMMRILSRAKINDAYSKYCKILFGVTQGSILGLVLFANYICDMSYDINDCDISNYDDYNTPYASSRN